MALLNFVSKKILTVGLTGTDSVVFMPGINEVDEAKLDVMKKHPGFNQLVKDGKMVILEAQKLEKDGKRTVDDMLEYIPKIFDTKLLKKIIKEDGRNPVTTAAKTQLDSILTPSKEEKKTDEHFT
jgi:hypothetical protein